MGKKVETEFSEIIVNGKKYIEASRAGNTEPVVEDGLTYCIVRTYSAGVFAGFYNLEKIEKIGKVTKARRIFYWDGAATLSQLAKDGTVTPEECKFPDEVDEIYLTDIIEVIPCTKKARDSIDSVPVWKR